MQRISQRRYNTGSKSSFARRPCILNYIHSHTRNIIFTRIQKQGAPIRWAFGKCCVIHFIHGAPTNPKFRIALVLWRSIMTLTYSKVRNTCARLIKKHVCRNGRQRSNKYGPRALFWCRFCFKINLYSDSLSFVRLRTPWWEEILRPLYTAFDLENTKSKAQEKVKKCYYCGTLHRLYLYKQRYKRTRRKKKVTLPHSQKALRYVI